MRKENRGETLRIEEGEVWERWEVRAARAGMGAVWEIAPEPPKGDKLEKNDGRCCGSGGSYGKGGNYGSSERGEKEKTLLEFWGFDKVY